MLTQFIVNYQQLGIPPETTKHLIQSFNNIYIKQDITRCSHSIESNLEKIFGLSPKMIQLKKEIRKVAMRKRGNVFISGESGTGKSLVAQCIHCISSRKNNGYGSFNCATLTEGTFHSQLFGHQKGSFTGAEKDQSGIFEHASNGTVFLDEIAELSPKMQAALLTFIEDGSVQRIGANIKKHVDCRIITATNKNLRDEVEKERFRNDLLFRLTDGSIIESPPLRERQKDKIYLALLLITDWLYTQYEDTGNQSVMVTESFLSAIDRYTFPGNIRELRGIIGRALDKLENNILDGEDFSRNVYDTGSSTIIKKPKNNRSLEKSLISKLNKLKGIRKGNTEILANALLFFDGKEFAPKDLTRIMQEDMNIHSNTVFRYIHILKDNGYLNHNGEATNRVKYLLRENDMSE